MDMALKKQDEIKRLIATTISDMREDLLQRASDYDFIGKICLLFSVLNHFELLIFQFGSNVFEVSNLETTLTWLLNFTVLFSRC